MKKMIKLYLKNVGHGLTAGFELSNKKFQIDCGADAGKENAAFDAMQKFIPDVYFLSHFHKDHYNGLLYGNANSQKIKAIREIYFPLIPKNIKNRKTFLACLLAINTCYFKKTFGSGQKTITKDFLDTISSIADNKFAYRPITPRTANPPYAYTPLSQGDRVKHGKNQIKVLWPPKIWPQDTEPTVNAIVEKAIESFKEACMVEGGQHLENVYSDLVKEKIADKYVASNVECQPDSGDDNPRMDKDSGSNQKRKDFKCLIAKANKDLKNAADYFSLAFNVENELLFLGDLKKKEIENATKVLNNREFYAFLAPHHGTRWSDVLKRIKVGFSLISEAPTKSHFVKICNYCSISNRVLCTYCCGDIKLPPSYVFCCKRRKF